MVLVLAKASQYANKCARDTCEIKTEIGKPYVYDTEAKKAYCSKECGEMVTNQKVVEASTNGKSKATWNPKPMQDLWRKPEEALIAIKIWHETVIPMILETVEKIGKTKPSVHIEKYGLQL